jgi:sigma-B regulation protein RsbU (phosphoserine phosphatase)
VSPKHGLSIKQCCRPQNNKRFLQKYVVATGICITFLVSSNLTRPIEEIVQVLREVRRGQFGKRVRVTSNDELGYAGDVINEMTAGLLERDRLCQSLALAMEVQQNLLPRTVPDVKRLDIFSKAEP